MHISILAPMCRVSIYPIIIFTMRLTPTIVQAEAVVCRKSRAKDKIRVTERVRKSEREMGEGKELNRETPPTIAALATTITATTTTTTAASGQHYYVCVRACVCWTELILNLLRSLFHQQEDEQHDSTARDWWLNESERETEEKGERERERVAESKKVMWTHYLDPTTSIITFMDPGGFQLQLRTATFRKFFAQLYSAFRNCIQLYTVLL